MQRCSISDTTQFCIHISVSTSMLASCAAHPYTVYWRSGVQYLGLGWHMSDPCTLIQHTKASPVNSVQVFVVKNP